MTDETAKLITDYESNPLYGIGRVVNHDMPNPHWEIICLSQTRKRWSGRSRPFAGKWIKEEAEKIFSEMKPRGNGTTTYTLFTWDFNECTGIDLQKIGLTMAEA